MADQSKATLESPQARQFHCANCGHGKGHLHELKTRPHYFRDIQSGHKQFELRKNDRGFKVGDTLWLREWDPEKEQYTGREIYKRVNYMLGGGFGLQEGYVIMGIQPA